MNTEGLIESRNIDLWNSLSSVYEIDIKWEKRDTYSVSTKTNKAIIYVPLGKSDSASFTHELLHIYLETKKVFISGGLKLYVREYPTLSTFLSEEFLDHLGNCLEHIKMLPEFLRMGFSSQEFILDFSVNKLNDQEIWDIKMKFKTINQNTVNYNSTAIRLYIAKYFAVKACPNKLINYEKGLSELKNVDNELYNILEEFMNEWEKFDYNDSDPVTGDYNFLLSDFMDDLLVWTKDKSII